MADANASRRSRLSTALQTSVARLSRLSSVRTPGDDDVFEENKETQKIDDSHEVRQGYRFCELIFAGVVDRRTRADGAGGRVERTACRARGANRAAGDCRWRGSRELHCDVSVHKIGVQDLRETVASLEARLGELAASMTTTQSTGTADRLVLVLGGECCFRLQLGLRRRIGVPDGCGAQRARGEKRTTRGDSTGNAGDATTVGRGRRHTRRRHSTTVRQR